MHVYLRTNRTHTLDSALDLVDRAGVQIWPLGLADVTLARQLHDRHPTLGARDLCHIASCRRRGVKEVMTFDQALAAAVKLPTIRQVLIQRRLPAAALPPPPG